MHGRLQSRLSLRQRIGGVGQDGAVGSSSWVQDDRLFLGRVHRVLHPRLPFRQRFGSVSQCAAAGTSGRDVAVVVTGLSTEDVSDGCLRAETLMK